MVTHTDEDDAVLDIAQIIVHCGREVGLTEVEVEGESVASAGVVCRPFTVIVVGPNCVYN